MRVWLRLGESYDDENDPHAGHKARIKAARDRFLDNHWFGSSRTWMAHHKKLARDDSYRQKHVVRTRSLKDKVKEAEDAFEKASGGRYKADHRI